MFQFFKTPFSTKIMNFTKFAVLNPKFMQNFSSKASNLAKIQFFKPFFFPGGTQMLRHTGMCRPNGLLTKKSLDMGPILVKKILRRGSHFTKIAKKF